jgi:transporter family protein
MKVAVSPQILALCTALAWGIGGFFEKKGLLLGDLSPQIGITVRTAVALLVLATVSFPQWKTLLSAEPRVWLYLVLGGGVLAGAVGMLCFYGAIKGAPLSRVMPIAFTSPLFGALMGILFASEPLTPKTIVGTGLTVGGIVVLSL